MTFSHTARLATMGVGQCEYVETSLEGYPALMRALNPAVSRRPEWMSDWEFKTNLFTAVSSQTTGDIRYLVCVERKK